MKISVTLSGSAWVKVLRILTSAYGTSIYKGNLKGIEKESGDSYRKEATQLSHILADIKSQRRAARNAPAMVPFDPTCPKASKSIP